MWRLVISRLHCIIIHITVMTSSIQFLFVFNFPVMKKTNKTKTETKTNKKKEVGILHYKRQVSKFKTKHRF